MMAADSIAVAARMATQFKKRHNDTTIWLWSLPDAVSNEDLWCAKIRATNNLVVLARWHSLTVGTISAMKDEVT